MSKICSLCGTHNDDNATACAVCGAAFDELVAEFAPAESNPTPAPQAVKPSERKPDFIFIIKKNIIPISAAVAGILFLIILISCVSSGGGYRSVTKKTVEYCYKSQKYDKMPKLTSRIVRDSFEERFNEQADEELSEKFENTFEYYVGYFENELESSNYSVKYKIEKEKNLSKTKREEVLRKYINEDELKDYKLVKEVDVTVTAKKGPYSEEQNLILYLVKEKGSWKIIDVAAGF